MQKLIILDLEETLIHANHEVIHELSQLIMTDNSPEKLVRHDGRLVRMADFCEQKNDNELLKLIGHLHRLVSKLNVRAVEKRHWRFAYH